ncbi:MAG: hypothetical protein R3C68_17410 [Myxococcota bacterium]
MSEASGVNSAAAGSSWPEEFFKPGTPPKDLESHYKRLLGEMKNVPQEVVAATVKDLLKNSSVDFAPIIMGILRQSDWSTVKNSIDHVDVMSANKESPEAIAHALIGATHARAGSDEDLFDLLLLFTVARDLDKEVDDALGKILLARKEQSLKGAWPDAHPSQGKDALEASRARRLSHARRELASDIANGLNRYGMAGRPNPNLRYMINDELADNSTEHQRALDILENGTGVRARGRGGLDRGGWGWRWLGPRFLR